MRNRNLCIIPARGGSKRIPGKNIKDFHGKPIIAYSIEAALESKLFDEVMVSTDDVKIAEISKAYGAKVPFFRNSKNADDFATTVDVLLEVIGKYEEKEVFYEYACCLYPTAPFITDSTLAEGYRKLNTNEHETVFSAVRYSFPVQRAVKICDGRAEMLYPEHIKSRSQDLEPIFHDAGQFYWFKVGVIKMKKTLWTNNTGIIEISPLKAQDIDNEIDWKLAELKHQLKDE